MEIERYKDPSGTHYYNTPANSDDILLFKHCSGGKIAVTDYEMNNFVSNLLFIHGVGIITTVDMNE